MPYIRHSLKDNIPDFVEYNYELFVHLLELYYQHVFENTDAKILLDEHRYIQGDEHLDNYIDKLKNELGLDIPVSSSIKNKSLITHYLNLILSKRGSEAAIKAFFRLSFNENAMITYPHKLLFISSITKHDNLNTCLLRTDDIPTGNFYSLRGYSSNLYGDIENMSYFDVGGVHYILVEFHSNDTLKLNERVDLMGSNSITCYNEGVYTCDIKNEGKLFNVDDIITFNDAIVQGEFKVTSVIKDGITINIDEGGVGYKVGDVILSNPNYGFFAKVHTTDDTGKIQEVKVYNEGDRYTDLPEIYIISSTGKDAKLRPFTKKGGGIKTFRVLQPTLLPKSNSHKVYSSSGVMLDVDLKLVPQTRHSYFINNNHKTSINNFIIDSKDNHNYSYNIITQLDIKYWGKYLDKYLHRSGYTYKHIRPVEVNSKQNGKFKVEML